VTDASRPWLRHYPPGVPAAIGPVAEASVGELLVRSCARFSGRPAFASMGRTMRFGELEKASADFAAYLQSLGLERGSRVALMMPNLLQYPVAMMGALRAGMTVVNVNPLYTARELERQLADCGAEVIVVLENFAATLASVTGGTALRHVVVAAVGDMLGLVKGAVANLAVRRIRKLVPAWNLPGHVTFLQALAAGRRHGLKPASVGPDDLAFLQYTGGTTGRPKGAMLLHRNILANVAQSALWLEAAYRVKPKPERPVFLCALPLYHVYALTVNAIMGVQQGGLNVLIANPRDIPALVKEMGRYPVNIFPGLNTLFNALLHNAAFHKLDFKPLLLTFGAGMAVQRGVAERWKAATGINIVEGYGLSETAPVAIANRLDDAEFSGAIGMPIPSTEAAILGEDDRPLPPGEAGEIAIRGPQVMKGYWNQPEETAAAFTADGYFRTGDIGVMDERGSIRVVDRKKDMILVSGFNVYPNELEEVAAAHPGVLEVAAVGVPDAGAGEVPKLFVVRRDASLTAEALLAFCREQLTGYKRPRHVEFRDSLPKSNVGKILRRELRG
jgi:long-chain acyl-CoA synthetase